MPNPTEESLVPLRRKRRDFGWLYIICAGLLPLVLGIVCTAIEARHMVRQQQEAGRSNSIRSRHRLLLAINTSLSLLLTAKKRFIRWINAN
ncbi:hypothetical protein CRX72_26670 [Pantoea sp. BRM17]|nr:hypothetical protein CRX72_26670 [Pantoea sp. BRM17]